MKRFFKSKFFSIIVFLAIFLGVGVTLMSALGYSSSLKAGVNYIFSPVQKAFSYVGQALDGYGAYITKFDDIKAENEELKKQIAELEDKIYDAEALKNENEFYKNYLEMKEKHLDYKFEDAYVIGREAGNYLELISLNKGTESGIDIGMPVISKENALIGTVSEVGENWAKVTPILDSYAAVGVYDEKSSSTGIIVGDYQLSREGLCKLEYISDDAEIEIGDRIVTSGNGSIYPEGIVVGIVERIETDDNLRTSYAVVRPSADLTKLDRIMVITDYEGYFTGE